MEFHGEFSMEIHGVPWNSVEVFHTGASSMTLNYHYKKTIVVMYHRSNQHGLQVQSNRSFLAL